MPPPSTHTQPFHQRNAPSYGPPMSLNFQGAVTSPNHLLQQPSPVVTQIGVPDHLVGFVLGKGGAVLKTITSNSGARIKVSQKGDYIAGTTNRSITMEGSQEQVQYAHSAIMKQLNSYQAKPSY